MALQENIEKLNKKYEIYGLQFRSHQDIIIIDDNYAISSNKNLKQELKDLYSISFDWENKYWYIGETGVKYLKTNKIKVAPSEISDDLKKQLLEFIEMIEDKNLGQEIIEFLKNNPDFYQVPCATTHHHTYLAGLLEHTVQTCKISISIAKSIANELIIDKDILIAGSILHDIGKINCYKCEDGKIDVTRIFKEQEHIINGIKIVSQKFKTSKLDEIIHIIASHHNLKDWGSPIQPSSNEAWIIHFAENLSSKILG